MITVILAVFLGVLAVVFGFAFWGGNANRRAGKRPDGSHENPNFPPH